MGKCAYFKPISEHSPVVELPSTSISLCACDYTRKNQNFNPFTSSGLTKKFENENTVKVGQFLGKTTFKEVL